jgi:hypothetical protein
MIQENGAVEVYTLVKEGRIAFEKCIVRDTQRGKLIINFAALRIRKSKDNIPIP